MPDLQDGESAEVQGSARVPYILKNVGGVYSCTCPAWRNQSKPIEQRSCKHSRGYLGEQAEQERLGGSAAMPATAGHPGRGTTSVARQHRAAAARRDRDVAGAERARWPSGGSPASKHPAATAMRVAMQLVVAPDGGVRCVYGEEIALQSLGRVEIRRASHVEPDAQGRWFAGLGPVGGPMLGPFQRRSDALAAEVGWLEANRLTSTSERRV